MHPRQRTWPMHRNLVQPAAMHHQRVCRSKRVRRLRHRPHPFRRIHPDHLPRDPCRIGQRPQQVENRPPPQRPAHGGHLRQRRMVPRRMQKHDATIRDAGLQTVKRQIRLPPQRRKHIGRPRKRRRRPVAMLGNRHSARRHHKSHRRRNIHRVGAVPARAHHIDGPVRRHKPYHPLPHCARSRRNLRRRLAPLRKRQQKGCNLALPKGARQHQVKRLARPPGIQRQRRIGQPHACSPSADRCFTPAISRKFASIAWPCSVAMLSG